MPQTILRFEYFLAVMEYRNISHAAEALRVSQPTLSRQIRALEREFNVPLLIRHGRGVSLTEAGTKLGEGLRGFDRQLRSLKDEVAAASSEPSGEVAFGLPPSPRSLLAVPVIQRLTEACPQVAVRIAEETSGDIRDLVASGELDLAITNSDEPMKGLLVDPLATEPLLLVGPRSSGLSLGDPVPISMLAKAPLVLTTRPNSLRRVVEHELARHGLRPQVRIEANTLPLMTDLVAQGLGYTLLPSCSVLALVHAGMLSASPVSGIRGITWMIARPSNRGLSAAAKVLLEMITATAQDLIAAGRWPMARALGTSAPAIAAARLADSETKPLRRRTRRKRRAGSNPKPASARSATPTARSRRR